MCGTHRDTVSDDYWRMWRGGEGGFGNLLLDNEGVGLKRRGIGLKLVVYNTVQHWYHAVLYWLQYSITFGFTLQPSPVLHSNCTVLY